MGRTKMGWQSQRVFRFYEHCKRAICRTDIAECQTGEEFKKAWEGLDVLDQPHIADHGLGRDYPILLHQR